jgi:hypothetical protein
LEKEEDEELPVLRPGLGDQMLPHKFFDILFHRYFPVLSFTYIASIVGIVLIDQAPNQNFIDALLYNKKAFDTALLVGIWVSIPSVIWITLKSSIRFPVYANLWYKVIAMLMTMVLLVSLIFFPVEEFNGGIRLFMVASVPVFLAQYVLFVHEEMPRFISWPLTIIGLLSCIYGLFLNFVN